MNILEFAEKYTPFKLNKDQKKVLKLVESGKKITLVPPHGYRKALEKRTKELFNKKFKEIYDQRTH